MRNVTPQMRQLLACRLAIVAPLLLIGCGPRRDEAVWKWSLPPVRATAEDDAFVDLENVGQGTAAPGGSNKTGPRGVGHPADSRGRPDSPITSPHDVLEAAGAVIEHDAQGRPAGVDLSKATLSTELMQAVASLGEIEWLDLRGARANDEHLAVLERLPQLQLLALGDTQVTDDGLRHIQNLKELRFLSLDHTSVSDVGLMRLAGMPQLEGVSLQGTRVTQAGARSFEARTPKCNLILDEDAPADSPVSTPPQSPELFPGDASSSIPESHSPNPQWESPQSGPMPSQPVTDVRQTRQTLADLLRHKLLDPEILEALGQHLLAQRNYRQAVRAYEAVLGLQPENLAAHFGLAVALARVGQFDAARPHFVTVVGDATALYNLGVIAYESQQPDVSERYFQRALSHDGDFDEARNWLAYLSQQRAVTPTSHTPAPIDEQDLVNLLMSEFGRSSETPEGTAGSEIQIVPAGKSSSPDRQQINW